MSAHETHCCVLHGCKYGDENCPVVKEVTEQIYSCEDCLPNYYDDEIDKRCGSYRHFKGIVYEVFEIAKDSSTLEEVAVYRDKNYNAWVRPWKEFDDIHPTHNVKRFKKI